jgi:PAS domain S-box-containing protein
MQLPGDCRVYHTPVGGAFTMRQIITKSFTSYGDFPVLRPGTIGAYALAFMSVVFATALRAAIDPYVVGLAYVTFVPAILITTLIGGFGAGFFCVVLSAGHMQASKDRLQLALDTAQLGWWQYDPRCRLVMGDARFKEIVDVTSDEMPVEDIRKLVHPQDAERFLADREAASDPANPRRSPHEYRVQRQDGEVRWVEVRWLAYFDDERRQREAANVVGTVHDITERKEREEREHLLMREINHRAKKHA